MKSKKTIPLSLIVLGCGGVGLGLRCLLYATGFDGKGLLSHFHPLTLICWAMAAIVAAAVFLKLRRTELENEYDALFPASFTGAVGSIGAAVGSISLGFQIMDEMSDGLTQLWCVLSFLSALCFIVTAGYRNKGKRTPFILHAVICLFYCAHMVCQYRVWSSNPQVSDYAFPLLACVMLALTALHRTTFDVDSGKPRGFLFTSLMAVFFCILSLVGPEHKVFYLCSGVWALGNILSPRSQEAESGEV